MIPHLEITIDTLSAEKHLTDMQKRQIPFALATTMNKSMIDAQRAVRGSAYNQVFTVRNRSLAKALTTIPSGHWANKSNLSVTMMNVRGAGDGFIERQIAGRTKIAKGRNIAVPVLGPGMRRLKGGGIPKSKKPRVMGDKLVRKGAGLYERQRKGLVKRYTLTKTARPNRRGRFRYHQTGTKVILRVVHGHWATAFSRALATARR